ncbi:MAG: metal-dependent hydrolase [Gemmatimonadetes bacterium]|nr:metal-dependent hydrolase [Gemmatimonadota bacterium]
MDDDVRYPTGKFQRPEGSLTAEQRAAFIREIAALPAQLREAAAGLGDEQLDTPYRPGGWTVRQLLHHVPDSHMNAYVRFKLALTEEDPTIKTYEEAAWARLEDTRATPVETSLALLAALHERWVNLLRSLTPADFARTLRHPESGPMTLDALLAMYAWHSRHHLAHVTRLRQRMGW